MISHHQTTARFHVTQFSSEHSLDTIYAVICTYFHNNERTYDPNEFVFICLSLILLIKETKMKLNKKHVINDDGDALKVTISFRPIPKNDGRIKKNERKTKTKCNDTQAKWTPTNFNGQLELFIFHECPIQVKGNITTSCSELRTQMCTT